MRLILTLATCLFLSLAVQAQDSNKWGLLGKYVNYLLNDTADVSKPKLLIYPTLAFAPETNWEIGFSSLYVYYANRDTTNRLSEFSGFTFYTLENQYGLWLDHAAYTDKNKWFFLGRVRYQSFPLLYYGIGPNTPSEYIAEVDANFLLIKERVLREIRPSLYGGLEFDFQRLSSVNVELSDPEQTFVSPVGIDGSTNFGLGLGLVYDNLHNALNARDGLFSELAFLRYDETWGSDYSFTTVISDNRIYLPVNKRDVFAAQLYGQFTTTGNAPFNQIALMGGENLMRGYYLGRYRDENLIAGQVEYRLLPFKFSKRIGASAFLSAGQVYGQDSDFDFSKFLPAGGIGVRYLLFPNKDIYTRIDFAITQEGTGFYFFIGEAF